jgi:apolipoprotein N-acyltransferase
MKTKPIIPALAAAILLALSWPANGFPYLILVALVPLFYLEDHFNEKRSLRGIWFYSYLALFIWNLLTTWWIWNSTAFGAIMAIVLNSLFMSWVWVLFSWTRRYMLNQKLAIYLFPIYWMAFEYLHLDWDLSWSWLNLGNAFANHTYAIQWYEYTGTLGGTWWIIIANILAYKASKKIDLKSFKSRHLLRNSAPFVLMVLVPVILSLYVYFNYEENGKPTEIVVVQPNMDPWSEQFLSPPEEVINRMITLSEPLLSYNTQFWIAPESAIQEGLKEPELTNRYGKSISVSMLQEFMIQYPNLQMIAGASTWKYLNEKTDTYRETKQGLIYDEYNTALLLNAQGLEGTYHKSKLVPGPEKMPFKKVLKPLQEVAFDLGGTVGSLGYDKHPTLFYSKDKSIAAAPLICYESIYGGFVTAFVRKGANILVIITNDGWWGHTAGHRQHMAYARLRAVETRRSLARSANTGISGFINQRGDIVQSTKYWVQDARKDTIKANNKLTYYVKYGDFLGRASVFFGILLFLISLSVYMRKLKR